MTIVFTVTNDLTYDQRMQRICRSLATSGYDVLLVGRALPHSIALKDNEFRQKRLKCRFNKGFLFYAEYNLRLCLFLLRASYDAVCSIDLDTLPAGFAAAALRGKKRVFDAHEYFTEVPEVVNRPVVKAFWSAVARFILPQYRHAYTVGPQLANIFHQRYGFPFEVIRNVPKRLVGPLQKRSEGDFSPKIVLYQGALNAGRGIEQLLDAMQHLEDVLLLIAGEGDLSEELRHRAQRLNLGDKVRFLGFVEPEPLRQLTGNAWLGVNLLENKGLSYYYSLANKFFDYVQAAVPVLTMDFPEYHALNNAYEVALLLPDLQVQGMVQAINRLKNDPDLYLRLQKNCCDAREVWHWENEEQRLLAFWKNVFAD